MRDGSPSARCLACSFEWRSAAMAEGLRLLGSCPRCGGELAFGEAAVQDARAEEPVPDVDPARVLGTPRRWDV